MLIIAKVTFFVLGEGPANDINGSIGATEINFSINFSKAKTKFCFSLHCNYDNGYLFVNGKESISLKQIIKILTFQLNFV